MVILIQLVISVITARISPIPPSLTVTRIHLVMNVIIAQTRPMITRKISTGIMLVMPATFPDVENYDQANSDNDGMGNPCDIANVFAVITGGGFAIQCCGEFTNGDVFVQWTQR